MELAQGSLRGFLQLCGQSPTTTATVPSSVCQMWAMQLLRGCAELHRQNCVHRDIKPDNVLVFLDGAQPPILKIADLGLAREMDEGAMTMEVCTLWYRAPEIIGAHGYGSPVDVWSAGCTIVELFSGFYLFPETKPNLMITAMDRLLKHHLLPLRHPRVINGSCSQRWPKASESLAASGDNRALKALMGEGSPPKFVSVAIECLRLDPVARISAADSVRLLDVPTLGELPAAPRLPEREPAEAAAARRPRPAAPAAKLRTCRKRSLTHGHAKAISRRRKKRKKSGRRRCRRS